MTFIKTVNNCLNIYSIRNEVPRQRPWFYSILSFFARFVCAGSVLHKMLVFRSINIISHLIWLRRDVELYGYMVIASNGYTRCGVTLRECRTYNKYSFIFGDSQVFIEFVLKMEGFQLQFLLLFFVSGIHWLQWVWDLIRCSFADRLPLITALS